MEVAITLLNLLSIFYTFIGLAKYETSSMFPNNAKKGLALTTLSHPIPQSVPQYAFHHHCKFLLYYLSFPQRQQTFHIIIEKRVGEILS
jgi:hypothetical protein